MGKIELEWLYSTQKIESGHQQYEVMNPSSVDIFVAYNRSYWVLLCGDVPLASSVDTASNCEAQLSGVIILGE